MITEETIVKKIIPEEGYLLTNGETVSDVIFMDASETIDGWGEIPDENYIPGYDDSLI